jgi:hypothetical protein
MGLPQRYTVILPFTPGWRVLRADRPTGELAGEIVGDLVSPAR